MASAFVSPAAIECEDWAYDFWFDWAQVEKK